jgi:hypothetical protein
MRVTRATGNDLYNEGTAPTGATTEGRGMTAPEHAHARKAAFADYLRQNQSRLYGYVHSSSAISTTPMTCSSRRHPVEEVRRLRHGPQLLLVGVRHRSPRSRQLPPAAAAGSDCIQRRSQSAADRGARRSQTRSWRIAAGPGALRRKLRQRDRDLLTECYGDADASTMRRSCHGRSTHSIYNSLRRIRRALSVCGPHARPGVAAGWIP